MFSGRSARWVVLALCALMLLAPSTTSLALSTVERPVSATVAGDDDGFLTVEPHDIYLDNGNHKDVTLFTVTNNLGAPAQVSMDLLSGDKGPPPVVNHPSGIAHLAHGESGGLTADVTCANSSDKVDDISVEITASAEDTTVTLTRSVTIHCTGDSPGNDEKDDEGKDDEKEDDEEKADDSHNEK